MDVEEAGFFPFPIINTGYKISFQMVFADQLQKSLMWIETADNKFVGLIIIAVLGFHPFGPAAVDYDFADRFGPNDHPAIFIQRLAHYMGQMVCSAIHQAVIGRPIDVQRYQKAQTFQVIIQPPHARRIEK